MDEDFAFVVLEFRDEDLPFYVVAFLDFDEVPVRLIWDFLVEEVVDLEGVADLVTLDLSFLIFFTDWVFLKRKRNI